MKDMIEFLRELKMNNNREWFCKNKHRYQEVQGRFNEFTERLIHGIASFDPTIANLGVKDCTYRIYRDVRFSEDKSPYKTHLGAVICRGGKKSGFAGYYFHGWWKRAGKYRRKRVVKTRFNHTGLRHGQG